MCLGAHDIDHPWCPSGARLSAVAALIACAKPRRCACCGHVVGAFRRQAEPRDVQDRVEAMRAPYRKVAWADQALWEEYGALLG